MRMEGIILAAKAILLSALVAGLLDLTASGVLMRSQGIPLPRLLQFIASGALGPSAFEGGRKTSLLGLFFHFLIALLFAAAWFAIARSLPTLQIHPLLAGAAYGVFVHLIMSRIVVPLSRARRPFSLRSFLVQFLIHIVCVGSPIVLTQTYFL